MEICIPTSSIWVSILWVKLPQEAQRYGSQLLPSICCEKGQGNEGRGEDIEAIFVKAWTAFIQGRKHDMWELVGLDHPSNFDTLAMDSKLKRDIMENMERFVKSR